ncbi:hypothetical protein ACFYYY_08600 [Streptomyces sp. NPDC001834]|uniref:hypothetical protein n=1 Tax=Streptomyces sp. NPDC001834 TaxID=3364616 RepID=UPI0036C8D70F
MTTADGPHGDDTWAAAIRRRTGLGRLLPRGGPEDGSWIAERAAVAVLREAVNGPGPGPMPVLGELRIRSADPDAAPKARLRMEATMAALSGRPLPAAAGTLRTALLSAADRHLGLVVSEVDLRVTELLDSPPAPRATAPLGAAGVRAAKPEGVAGTVAAGVPGVATLTRVLGEAVHTAPGYVRVELATERGHRVLDVARAVRGAVTDAVPGRPSVAGRAGHGGGGDRAHRPVTRPCARGSDS